MKASLTDFPAVLIVRVVRPKQNVADRTCKVLDMVLVPYGISATRQNEIFATHRML